MPTNETLTILPLNVNPFETATLLDEQGHETPITEEMILKACQELMKLCEEPRKAA